MLSLDGDGDTGLIITRNFLQDDVFHYNRNGSDIRD